MIHPMAILPQDRSPQEWVDFYLKIESDVASGKSRTFNGRNIQYEDLAEIRISRKDWESRVLAASRPASTKRIGGLRYKTAQMN